MFAGVLDTSLGDVDSSSKKLSLFQEKRLLKFIPRETSTTNIIFNKSGKRFYRDSRNLFAALFRTVWKTAIKTNAFVPGFY